MGFIAIWTAVVIGNRNVDRAEISTDCWVSMKVIFDHCCESVSALVIHHRHLLVLEYTMILPNIVENSIQ